MSKETEVGVLKELIRDADRPITAADRHAILNLIEALERSAANTPIDADMVWMEWNGDAFFHSIDDAVDCEVDNAHPYRDDFEMKLSLGKRIPDATVRVFNITENAREWEIVTAGPAASGVDQEVGS